LLPNVISDQGQLPTRQVAHFLKKVIDVTHKYCAAYKPNIGFFEALGAEGIDIFVEILEYIPENKVVIADAKRGDISSTAEHYAKAFFEQFDVDSVTLNPLMGFETLEPFLTEDAKGIYVLTLTSNQGASDILLKKISSSQTVASYIATELKKQQSHSRTTIGMVVGATNAEELRPIMNKFPNAPLLIPGVGKQGGSITKLTDVLQSHKGIPLINSSRSIIYAGNNQKDWQKSVANSAKDLKEKLSPITNKYV
jgi:orotidine-5'-phosphate decarboxylase